MPFAKIILSLALILTCSACKGGARDIRPEPSAPNATEAEPGPSETAEGIPPAAELGRSTEAADDSEQGGGAGEIIAQHREAIMKMPGVVGLAVGQCRSHAADVCVLVYVKSDKWPENLPRRLDGYDVELVETGGEFRPQ